MNISLISDSSLLQENSTAEAHVFAVGGACAIDGDTVSVFGGVDAVRGIRNGCQKKTIPFILTLGSRTLYTFWATLFAIFFEHAEVLHVYGHRSAAFIWLARFLRHRLVIVVTLFDTDYMKGKSAFKRFRGAVYTKIITRYANEIVVTQKSIQNKLLLEHGFLASWIPNGVSVKRSTVNDVVLRSYNIRSGGYIIFSVENIISNKSAQNAVNRIESEWRSITTGTVQLAILARNNQKIQTTGDTKLVLSPSVDTRKALFTGARAIVFSSEKNKDLLTDVLEAMSYGKSVIAPDASVAREVLQGFGIPYPVGDMVACKTAIEAVLADEMLAASIGHAARAHVEESYRWEATAQFVQELYHHHYLFREGILALR